MLINFFSALAFAVFAQTPSPNPVVVRMSQAPATLDWNLAHTYEGDLLLALMDGLVRVVPAPGGGQKALPALAESWTLSADQKTYVFTLRKGVTWSDGVPLKPQDFVASWKRLLSPLTAARYSYQLFPILNAEAYAKGLLHDFSQVGIKVVDERRISVTLHTRKVDFESALDAWVTFPVREDMITQHGNQWATPGRIVTLGRFLLHSVQPAREYVLKKNPNYWGNLVPAQRASAWPEWLKFLVIDTDETALDLFKFKKIDVVRDLSGTTLMDAATRSQLRTFPQSHTAQLRLVATNYPLNDPKIRCALFESLDRNKLLRLIGSVDSLAYSQIPPPLIGSVNAKTFAASKIGPEFNPTRARAAFNRMFSNGKYPRIELLTRPGFWAKLGEAMQAQWKSTLGVQVVLNSYENKKFQEVLDTKSEHGFIGFLRDAVDPLAFLPFLASSPTNRINWKNPQFDSWVQGAAQESRPSERQKLLWSAQRMIQSEECVILPLFHEATQILVSPRAVNARVHPSGELVFW